MPRSYPGVPEESEDDSLSISYNESATNLKSQVIGETVFISVDGIEVLASESGSFDSVHGYTFIDADDQEIGGAYARDDSGQNIVGFRVVDEAANGDDTALYLTSECESSATSTINIAADVDGQTTDTYIAFTKISTTRSDIDINTDETVGRVQIRPKLRMRGADAGDWCDVYIKDSYFIIKYLDGATFRYKYLDLSGTGATWTHSTAEP
jgi:hypothetical protein